MLKRSDSGFAKADAQFFNMIGGMPSGPELLLTSKSCKTLSTSFEVNQSAPKGGSSDTCSGPASEGTQTSSVYGEIFDFVNLAPKNEF
jgi:hypothetical protein